jgi:hypothetical protein
MSKIPIDSPKGKEDVIEEDNEQPVNNRHTLYWTDQVESLLSGWADTAAVYKWLHDKSHRKYKRKNKILAIPTMILSLVTGSLGIGLQGYVPAEYMSIGQGALGGMGVFIGILQGLQTQFGFAQRSEKHSGSSLGWGKLQRNIQIELSIEREFRKDADSFVKVCRMEYDRLTEQSPPIPSDILEMFKIIFKKQAEEKRKNEDEDLILPDICDSIKHTKVYKAAINNPDILIQSIYNIDKKDDPEKEEGETIVKQALNDRIKELDQRMSGITQFKLAAMGNRFAPIINQMSQNTDRYIHLEHPVNNRVRRSTEFQGIIEQRKSFSHTKPILGLPVGKKPLIDLGIRPNIKNLINKFTINADRQIEIVVENPLQDDTFIEPTKVEETKVEETKVEETKVDKVEETKVDKVEETKVDKVEETKVEETKVEETKVEEVIIIDIPPLIPKLYLENVKKEEEEIQNKSSKRKSSNKKPSTPSAVFVFKDDDEN